MFFQEIMVILISCVPVLEVKAAIPYGVLYAGIDKWQAMLLAQIGSLLTSILLLLLLRPVIKWMKKTVLFSRLAHKMESLGLKRGARMQNKINSEDTHMKKIWASVFGVFIFVAIPLPGTGVWTGSLIATMLDIRFKYSFPAVVIGNLVASMIMVAFSSIFIPGLETAMFVFH